MGLRQTLGRLIGGKAAPAIDAQLTQQNLDELLRAINAQFATASGATVTPDTAMRVMAVYAAVRVLAETVAQVPLITYRRDGRNKERATDHWAYRLLHDQPNTWQSSFEFREMMMGHLALRGNAFAFKAKVREEVHELLPLHPDRVAVTQNEKWGLVYTVKLGNGAPVTLGPSDILHLRGLSSDGFTGLSPIGLAREAVGLAIQTEKHGAQLFGNGARVAGVLSTENVLKEEQIKMIRESWKSAHGGENRLGTAVLDAGMKYQQMSLSSEDAQFIESRKFQISEIARLFRVPPHMIGDLDKATFSNIEQQSLEFVTYTIGPWTRRWEQALMMQLLPEREREDIYFEFLLEGLLRGDIKSRYEAYQIGITNGWFSPNEIRERENMNPREGGDEYRQAENIFGNKGKTNDAQANPTP